MLTTKVDIQELPSRFTELVSLSMAGTEVIVTESNIPRARLVPGSISGSRFTPRRNQDHSGF
jgi:antitoxin (DNA-binding transcriptional repressor) of toxin-antitoxin stability system